MGCTTSTNTGVIEVMPTPPTMRTRHLSTSSDTSTCSEEGRARTPTTEPQRPIRMTTIRKGSTVLIQSWVRKFQAQLRYKNEISTAIFQGMEYMDEAALFDRLSVVEHVLDDMLRTDDLLSGENALESDSKPAVVASVPIPVATGVVFDMAFVSKLLADVRKEHYIVDASIVIAILKGVSRILLPQPNIRKAMTSSTNTVTVIGWFSFLLVRKRFFINRSYLRGNKTLDVLTILLPFVVIVEYSAVMRVIS
jgi:hypothetical protein